MEDDIKIEPPQVTVRGLQADLATITSVNLDVNLSNQHNGTTVVDNELVAHSITARGGRCVYHAEPGEGHALRCSSSCSARCR